YDKFYSLSKLVQQLSGHAVPSNRQVVGDGLFQIESGIIASWYQNCGDENATELFPFHWDVVGQSPVKVVMGKGSGIDSVKNGLKNLGVQFNEEEAMRVVAAVKDFSLKHKRLLTDAEFRSIVTTTIPTSVAGFATGSGSSLTPRFSAACASIAAPARPAFVRTALFSGEMRTAASQIILRLREATF